MDRPNILITSPMSADYVAKLNADPRVGKAYHLPMEACLFFATCTLEARSASVFEDNLDRYLADQPLMNVAESYDEA